MDSASYHKGMCVCGYIGYESHMFENIGLGVMKCRKCSYLKKPTDENEMVHLGIADNKDEEMD